MKIQAISQNIAAYYFIETDKLLKQSVYDYFDKITVKLFKRAIKTRHDYTQITEAKFSPDKINEYDVTLIYYCNQNNFFIEIEPLQNENTTKYFSDIQTIHNTFNSCTTYKQLFNQFLRVVHDINEADNIILLKHIDDNCGQVIAQKKKRGETSYLDQFIPLQDTLESRPQHYELRPIRYIPDINYKPVKLAQAYCNKKIDLDRCLLRSVKKPHLSAIKALNYQAALSLALVVDKKIWGIVVLYYKDKRIVSVQHRNFLILLANLLSFFIRELQIDTHRLQQQKLLSLINTAAKKFNCANLNPWMQSLHQFIDYQSYAIQCGQSIELSSTHLLSSKQIATLIKHAKQNKSASICSYTHTELLSLFTKKSAKKINGALVITLDESEPVIIVLIRHSIEKLRQWLIQPKHIKLLHHTNRWSALDLIAAKHIKRLFIEKRLKEALTQKAFRDALTGLHNRFYLEETFQTWNKQCKNNKTTISIMIIDADYFKKINDQYGHDVGDKVLKGLAKRFISHVRVEDVVCRYGGEEFVILQKNIDKKSAAQSAEKVRQAIASKDFRCGKETLKNVTVSIGSYTYHPAKKQESLEAILKIADRALYKAKKSGRNHCIVK